MRRQAFDALVVGPTEQLFVFRSSAAEVASGRAEVRDAERILGGSGAHVAVGLRRLGLKVGLVTAVGRDPVGDDVVRQLSSEGIEIDFCARVALAGTALTVRVQGDQSAAPLAFRSRGATELVEVTEDVQTMLHTTRWLVVLDLPESAWTTAAPALLQTLSSEATKLAWRPTSAQMETGGKVTDALLARTDVLFVSPDDLRRLSGEKPADSGHTELEQRVRRAGVKRVVVGPVGDRIHLASEEEHVTVPWPAAPAPDPGGSLDALVVGIVGRLAGDGDARTALAWGITEVRAVNAAPTTARGLLTALLLTEHLRKKPVTIETGP